MLPELSGSKSAIEITAKEVAELAQPILGTSIGELSQLIADRVRFWRWKSAVRIMKRANEIREKEGLVGRTVPLKFFLPFVEEASKEGEDETEVGELWARLLATADKSTTGFDLVCLDILRSIGGAEAMLLRKIKAVSYLLEPVRDLSGKVVGTALEVRLKELLTEDKLARLGHGQQFHGALLQILDEEFKIPTVRLFGSSSKFVEENSFSILTLEKLGLIEGSTYWKDTRLKRGQMLGIIDLNFYQRLRVQRGYKQLEEDDDRRYMRDIGESLALSTYGQQFVQRCINSPRSKK